MKGSLQVEYFFLSMEATTNCQSYLNMILMQQRDHKKMLQVKSWLEIKKRGKRMNRKFFKHHNILPSVVVIAMNVISKHSFLESAQIKTNE